MILHCVPCSMNATRPMRESEIAVIDEEKLGLPLEGSMFLDLDPSRGIPKRLAGNIFREMKCLRHGGAPWGLTPEEAMKAEKNGGPPQVFTDKGWVHLVKSNCESLLNPPKLNSAPKPFRCMTCGKTFAKVQGLNGHVKVHKNANKNGYRI